MTYFSQHPFYLEAAKNIGSFSSIIYKKTDCEIGKYFNSKDLKVLEIGFGLWNFAYYCDQKWISYFEGIEIDYTFGPDLQKLFPDYKFIKANFEEYLNKYDHTYDIIFMSHVFEHLSMEEANNLITLVSTSLKKGGIFINYTPNAASILQSTYWRYCDLTHTTVYCERSINQLILNNWAIFSAIEHKNEVLGINIIKKIIYWFFILLTKIYYKGMGLWRPPVYTWQLITILKK